jgi:hypothetical protein
MFTSSEKSQGKAARDYAMEAPQAQENKRLKRQSQVHIPCRTELPRKVLTFRIPGRVQFVDIAEREI